MSRICVAGCKHTTKDLILGLEDKGFVIDCCITMSPEKGIEQKVAGYMDLRSFLISRQIEWRWAEKYNLKSEKDYKTIKNLNIDIMLVMGWQ